MLPRYKFYKLASHLIRQDTCSKEYEDVTLDRNKKRLKPHQIEQLRYELKSLGIEQTNKYSVSPEKYLKAAIAILYADNILVTDSKVVH
ncbi:hypothetical protein ACTLM6_000588 [Escherichia coli]